MRKIALNPNQNAEFRRAMIYDPTDNAGVYVFLFRSLDVGPCEVDYWYEDLSGAERHVAIEFGERVLEWQTVPNPLPGSEHDWIAPMRAVRDDKGWPDF